MNNINDNLYDNLPQITIVLGAALVFLGIVVAIINASTLNTLNAIAIVVMIGTGIILAIVGEDKNYVYRDEF